MSDGDSQLELGPGVLAGVADDSSDTFEGMLRSLEGIDLVDADGGEVDQLPVEHNRAPGPVPPPSGRAVPSLPRPAVEVRPVVRTDGMVAFPLLDTEDGPCLLSGPFLCADMGDGDPVPVISVYEPGRSEVLNGPVKATNRVYLGCITHDATEDELLKHFGPGAYQLAVRKEGGGFLRWGRVQVGRQALGRRQVAFVANTPQSPGLAGLGGGPAAAPNPILAELQKLNARLDKLESGQSQAQGAAGFAMQIRSTMERAETAMQELESLGELGTKLLTLRQKLAGPVAQVDEEPEEELGLIDGAAETLGNALAGASKLKSTMEQFKLLMGSGA